MVDFFRDLKRISGLKEIDERHKREAEEINKRFEAEKARLKREKDAEEDVRRKTEHLNLNPQDYLAEIRSLGVSDDPAVILRAIKTYHPDRFVSEPENQRYAHEIIQELIPKFQTLSIGEDTIPNEYKRFWPYFKSILEDRGPNGNKTREDNLQELYSLSAQYRDGKNPLYNAELSGAGGIQTAGSVFDKFLSLNFFLDTVLGHAVRMKEMGVQRDIGDPEHGFFIPEDLLGDEGTKKWHERHKNFASFAMLPGSGVLMAMKSGLIPRLFTLIRGNDGKYRLNDSFGYKLLYRTHGGLPIVADYFDGRKTGILDPRNGKFIEGYRFDTAMALAEGKIIDPEGRSVLETAVENKFLAGTKEHIKIEGK